MKRLTRLIRNGVLFAITLGIIVIAAPNFSGSRELSLIKGNTPFEKVSSMVEYLNAQKENDFAKVHFQEYDNSNRVWRFGIAFADLSLWTQPTTPQAQQEQQQKKELFRSIIRDLFVNTAKWDETARWIVITTVYPLPFEYVAYGNVRLPVYGFVYFSDEINTANIRKYPTEWEKYSNANRPEKFFGAAESVFQSVIKGNSTQTNDAKAPAEGGK